MPITALAALYLMAGAPAIAQTPLAEHVGARAGVSNVTSLAQDRDGRIWIGTTDGLFAYDGQDFRRYAEAEGLPGRAIGALAESAGVLWVGTLEGVSRKQGDRFVRMFDTKSPVISLAAGASGSLYFANSYLSVVRNSALLTDPNLRPTTNVSVSHRGDLWFGCGTEICRVEAAVLEAWKTPLAVKRLGSKDGLPSLAWASVAEDTDGVVWAGSYNQEGVWRKIPGRPFVRIDLETGAGLLALHRSGRVTVPGLGGHWSWSGQAFRFRALPGNLYWRAILEDAEGAIWIGGSGPGVWRTPPTRSIEEQTTALNSPLNAFHVGRGADGSLLASSNAGLTRLEPGTPAWKPLGPGFARELVYGFERDPDGGMLVGYEKAGLRRLTGDGKIRAVILDSLGKPTLGVRRLFVDREGTAWISTKESFYRLTRGASTAVRTTPVIGAADYRDIEPGRDGSLWVAFQFGLANYKDGKWRVLTTKDGLKSDYIRCVTEDGQGNIWIGYRYPVGFARLTPNQAGWDVKHFDSAGGYGADTSFFLKTDSRGWIWRGSNDGVYILRNGSADPVDWLHLSTEDGLPGNDAAQYSFFEDADGSVWFGTNAGIAHVALKAIERVARTRVNLTIANARLEGSDLKATLHPIAFAHRDRLRYRYRVLPGGDWIPSASSALAVAGVSLGDHTLEAQARRPGAMWSASAAWGLTRPPPFWITPPAIVSYATAAAGLLLLRVRRRRQFQREKALFLEIGNLTQGAAEARLLGVAPRLAARVRRLLEARPKNPTFDSEGMLLSGRYRLEARIAQGGMATIYRARDERLSNRTTAIKILRPDIGGAEWLTRRFEHERLALGRLQHPGVVAVVDVGQTPHGLAFLALEFVDGPTLRQLLANGPIHPIRAAAFLNQAADALQYAHDRGVTHRDLKPENLMIRHAGEKEERMVIVDFGIAVVRSPGDETLVLTHAAGTLPYMAPEQAQGRITPACDVYALGLIVFEMITGERAIPLGLGRGGDLPEAVRAHLSGRFSTEALDLLTSALRFSPDLRPAAIGDWGKRLAAHLRN